MVFSVSTVIRAEDDASSDDASASKSLKSTERANVQAGLKEKREMKDKRNEGRIMIDQKRKDFKKEMEVKREKMKEEIQVVREETKQKIEDLRAKIKEEKDVAKAKIKEARVVGREKVLERFNVAIERMNILKDRVVDNIAKFEAKGVNVTEAKSFIIIIETKLTGVKTKITEANALLSVSIDELTKEDKIKLRTLAQDAQTLMKEAHQAINNAIKSLKESVKLKREEVRDTKKDDQKQKDVAWESLLSSIRTALKSAFPNAEVEESTRVNVAKKADITGDGVSEAIVSFGLTGVTGYGEVTLMQIENNLPIASLFKQKDGKVSVLGFGSGTFGAGRGESSVELVKSKNAIYSGHYSAFNESNDSCGVEAYQWNAQTKVFDYNTSLSDEAGKDYCSKVCSSEIAKHPDSKIYFQKICPVN